MKSNKDLLSSQLNITFVKTLHSKQCIFGYNSKVTTNFDIWGYKGDINLNFVYAQWQLHQWSG